MVETLEWLVAVVSMFDGGQRPSAITGIGTKLL
jgi:hypothetical protein